jgi:thioredoxin-like negative regulator of GroEL
MKIIKFVQPSCMPCRMLDGLLSHLNLKVDETLDIAVDEKAFEYAQTIGVKSTPTIMLVDDNGTVIDRVSGINQEHIQKIFALKEC